MFNRPTVTAETRRRIQALLDKYNNFKRSTDHSYSEYEDVNTLVIMLNGDDELAELVTVSGVDEICELSPASKNRCRTSLNFNKEFRLHEKFAGSFRDGDMIMRVFDRDHPAQPEKYVTNGYSAILHCDWFGRDSKKVPHKFLSVIIDFLTRIRGQLTQTVLLGTDQSDLEHRHAYQQIHPAFFPKERFGPSFSPIVESKEAADKRAIEAFAKAGPIAESATRLSLARGITFEYATYKDLYECGCGKEHYSENVGLI
ncbi:MAG: hypothetical protein Q8R55_06055 [Candidatus Taylorbacteria bacterium]|nr:hypothetical protein [Candidatus Taylorbacteria bacterium]